MLVVVERGEELLKSKFVHGWVNYILVVDSRSVERESTSVIALVTAL